MPGIRVSNAPKRDASQVSILFSAAQNSITVHRRSIVSLHKLFLEFSLFTTQTDQGVRLTGEKEFMKAFRDCVDHLLDIKKGVTQADRVVKFVSSFFAYAAEEASKAAEDEDEDSACSRLASSILKHLIKGLEAANKNVRYRCTQIISQLVNVLPELDEDLFAVLRDNLLLRIKDKETAVRVQAIIGLAKLQTGEEDEDEIESPVKALRYAVQHDPSAEVRRAALFHLDVSEAACLDDILARTRDIDINNRRFIHQAKLIETAPDAIPLAHRKSLLKDGLRDREEAVRRSAGRLLAKWVDRDLLAFIKTFRIAEAADETRAEEVATLEDVVRSILDSRSDLAGTLQFDDAFWSDLSPESVLLARITILHYREQGENAKAEDLMPVATALAYRIEQQWHVLKTHLADAEPDNADRQAAAAMTLEQLLKLALLCDFSDEAGRRKMMDGFMDSPDQQPSGIRAIINDAKLPLTLIPACFDLLNMLVPQDTALIQVVIEIVHSLQESQGLTEEVSKVDQTQETSGSDSEDDVTEMLTTPNKDAPRKSAAPPPASPVLSESKVAAHTRCLTIVKALLERIVATLRDNPILRGLVHEVIVPAVRTKYEAIRELGIVCLGLCTLLDKDTAIESFGLFVNQAVNSEGILQETVYKIIFDILIINGLDFLMAKKNHEPRLIIDFISQALEQEPSIQAIAAVGIAKLMLSGSITDEEVLQKLAIVYFAPETLENHELRQCLTYFFPVYCYSSSANQRRMQKILLGTLDTLINAYEDAEDTDGLALPNQMALQLMEWIDPTKVIENTGAEIDADVHVDLAQDILKEVFKRPNKDERKRLVQMLPKLSLPAELDEWKIRSLLLLSAKLQEERPLADSVSRNALTRFVTSITKLYGDRAGILNDDGIQDVERLHEVATWLEEEGAIEQAPAAKAKAKRRSAPARGRRTRSKSAATSHQSDDSDADVPPLPTSNSAPRRSTTSTVKADNVQNKLSAVLKEEGISSDERSEPSLDVVEEDSEDEI